MPINVPDSALSRSTKALTFSTRTVPISTLCRRICAARVSPLAVLIGYLKSSEAMLTPIRRAVVSLIATSDAPVSSMASVALPLSLNVPR
ncbi:hypothetical protein D3C80_2005420 [compost metagenome]